MTADRATVLGAVLAVAIACPSHQEAPVSPTSQVLPAAAEQELAELRGNPLDAIGFGDKTYLPYIRRAGDYLARSDDAAVVGAIEAQARDTANPRVFRLALLHVIAAHPGADRALLDMLGDGELRALAAHLLGRSGFKGAPALTVAAGHVLDTLRPYLDDQTPYVDPWYRRTFRVGDFALAAFVRIAGPERFHIADPQLASFIGYDLPQIDAASRAVLIAECRALH